MRLLALLATVFTLLGCATSYTSLAGSRGNTEIIVGDQSSVMNTIELAISQKFPSSNVQQNQNSFVWRSTLLLDYTDFRLDVRNATGTDVKNEQVSGYFYQINSNGTQPLVMLRYVTPLNKAIKESVQSRQDLHLATISSMREVSVSEQIAASKSKIQACFDALTSSNELNSIRGKIALESASNQTFSMLTDNSKPILQEKQAILTWGNGRDQCFSLQRAENIAQNINPQIMAVLDTYTASQQNILAQLYMEKITYGDFSAKRQSIAATANEALADIQGELQKRSAEAQDRARQIAIQAEQNTISAINSFSQNIQMQRQNTILQQQIHQQNTILQHQMHQSAMRDSTPQRLQTTCNIIGKTMFCN